MAEKKKRSCFVISPIGEEQSEIRNRANQVLRHIITPCVQELGYDDPIRADRIAIPGVITSQVVEHILNDDLVIADLTGHNANVFYELSIRHIIRKPLVQIIDIKDRIPFDIATSRTIPFDYKDLDSVAHCKDELKKTDS
jgi:hypothetical protein